MTRLFALLLLLASPVYAEEKGPKQNPPGGGDPSKPKPKPPKDTATAAKVAKR